MPRDRVLLVSPIRARGLMSSVGRPPPRWETQTAGAQPRSEQRECWKLLRRPHRPAPGIIQTYHNTWVWVYDVFWDGTDERWYYYIVGEVWFWRRLAYKTFGPRVSNGDLVFDFELISSKTRSRCVTVRPSNASKSIQAKSLYRSVGRGPVRSIQYGSGFFKFTLAYRFDCYEKMYKIILISWDLKPSYRFWSNPLWWCCRKQQHDRPPLIRWCHASGAKWKSIARRYYCWLSFLWLRECTLGAKKWL